MKCELVSVEHWRLIVVGGVCSNKVVLLPLDGQRRILGFGESCLPERRRGNVATINTGVDRTCRNVCNGCIWFRWRILSIGLCMLNFRKRTSNRWSFPHARTTSMGSPVLEVEVTAIQPLQLPALQKSRRDHDHCLQAAGGNSEAADARILTD